MNYYNKINDNKLNKKSVYCRKENINERNKRIYK